ncbi:hypothetical protein ANANG_G00128540, partial [Anguilla anguilla]
LFANGSPTSDPISFLFSFFLPVYPNSFSFVHATDTILYTHARITYYKATCSDHSCAVQLLSFPRDFAISGTSTSLL